MFNFVKNIGTVELLIIAFIIEDIDSKIEAAPKEMRESIFKNSGYSRHSWNYSWCVSQSLLYFIDSFFVKRFFIFHTYIIPPLK